MKVWANSCDTVIKGGTDLPGLNVVSGLHHLNGKTNGNGLHSDI